MKTAIFRAVSIGAIRTERILSGLDPIDLRPLEAIKHDQECDHISVERACRAVCQWRGGRKHFGKAWLIYCLIGGPLPMPKDFGITPEVARQIERVVARYWIIDPINGFADTEALQRGRRTPRKVKRGCSPVVKEHLARMRREHFRPAMGRVSAVPF